MFPTLREGFVGEGGKRGECGGGSCWCRGRVGGAVWPVSPHSPRGDRARRRRFPSSRCRWRCVGTGGSPRTPAPPGRAPAAPPPGAAPRSFRPPARGVYAGDPPSFTAPPAGRARAPCALPAAGTENAAGAWERGPGVPLAAGSPPSDSGASFGEIKMLSASFRRAPLSPERREAPRDVQSLQSWGHCGRGAPGFPRFGVKFRKLLAVCSRSGWDLHVALRSFPSFSGFFGEVGR